MSDGEVRSASRDEGEGEIPGRVFLLLLLEGRLEVDLEVDCWDGSSVKREDDLRKLAVSFAPWVDGDTHALFDIAVSVVEALLLLDRDGGKA